MEEIYVLRLSMDAVSQRYFEGYSVLFPDQAERLDSLVHGWEGMLEWYNDTIASDFKEHSKPSEDTYSFRLDAEVIRQQAQKQLAERIEYLVDQAKADTLRALEDHVTASDIMEKHLGDDEDV